MKNVIFIVAILFTFFSCREDVEPADSIGFGTQLSQRVDTVAFGQIDSGLNNDLINTDQYFLRGADIIGSQLYIDVSYAGGCQEHAFELIWPEVITMIYPPQFDLILLHNGNGDMCEAAISETLVFDLLGNSLGLTLDVFDTMKMGIINASNPDEKIQVNE